MKLNNILRSTELGLKGPYNFQHFVHIDEKKMVNGTIIEYQLVSSEQGNLLILSLDSKLFGLQYVETENQSLHQISKKYPQARFEKTKMPAMLWQNFLTKKEVHFALAGSLFYFEVWKFLSCIPEGGLISYEFAAKSIGRPSSVRAVATAIGRNPIAIAIPCHRVIRKDGRLGGYRYGLERKKHLLFKELKMDLRIF